MFDNVYSPDRFNPDSWIGKHFFTGGAMPSRDLLVHPRLLQDLYRVDRYCLFRTTLLQKQPEYSRCPEASGGLSGQRTDHSAFLCPRWPPGLMFLYCVRLWCSRQTLSGEGYKHTANSWLQLLDTNRGEVKRVLGSRRAVQRWRIFFIVTAETWGHSSRDWEVSWYKLAKL